MDIMLFMETDSWNLSHQSINNPIKSITGGVRFDAPFIHLFVYLLEQ